MPRYKRKRYRRKNRLSGKVYKNYKSIKMLKNAVEHKFLDGTSEWNGIDDTGAQWGVLNLVNCNDVSADEDPDQMYRNGREIYATRIKIRGLISNTRGTAEDGIMRIIVVRRKDGDGALSNLFAVGGVLYNETAAGGSALSFMNKDNAHNYDIILDTTFAYDKDSHVEIPFKFSKKLKHTVRYNAAVGVTTAANVVQNCLAIYAVTAQGTLANAPNLKIEWRYSFMDM